MVWKHSGFAFAGHEPSCQKKSPPVSHFGAVNRPKDIRTGSVAQSTAQDSPRRRIEITTEANKRLMRRFMEFINSGTEALAGELISPEAIFHVPGSPKPMRGPSGYLAVLGMMRGGFPDIKWTLEEMIAEDDRIAARFTMRGTHQGPVFGVAPTGNTIRVQAMNFYRFSNGQIIEEYGQPDLLGLMQQIGAAPK